MINFCDTNYFFQKFEIYFLYFSEFSKFSQQLFVNDSLEFNKIKKIMEINNLSEFQQYYFVICFLSSILLIFSF
jgi:hypothetical protein